MITQDFLNKVEVAVPTFEDYSKEAVVTKLQGKIEHYECNENLENEVYHNSTDKQFCGVAYSDILSSSKMKAAITPRHLRAYLDKEITPEQQKAFDIGTAFHELLLEPEKFEYFLFDDTSIREEATILYKQRTGKDVVNVAATKEYKELAQTERAKNTSGAPEVTSEQFQKLNDSRKRMKNDKVVRNLLDKAKKEVSYFVKYQDGLIVKVRPDALKVADKTDEKNFSAFGVKEGDLLIVSVKTTIDASPDGFYRQIKRNGYHLSEAFYHDVIKAIHPENDVHVIILSLEKELGIYMIYPTDATFIEWGREEYAPRLDVYLDCSETQNYNAGYEVMNNGSKIIQITAPWA